MKTRLVYNDKCKKISHNLLELFSKDTLWMSGTTKAQFILLRINFHKFHYFGIMETYSFLYLKKLKMKVLKIKFAIWDFDKLFVYGIVLRLNSEIFWIFIRIWYFKNKFRNFKFWEWNLMKLILKIGTLEIWNFKKLFLKLNLKLWKIGILRMEF